MNVWWALARPKGSFWVGMLPLLGYGFAHWNLGIPARHPMGALALVPLWWGLSAGSLWLNAALDEDEGETLYGQNVPVPAGARAMGLVMLLGITSLSLLLGGGVVACLSGCAGLAVLYSWPGIAWKGHPLGGPMVNALGYGVLSPLAGYLLVGVPVDVRAVWVDGVLVASVLGLYFAAQAFQGPADAARGYRTRVVTHGPQGALGAARGLLWTAAFLMLAGTLVGLFPRMGLLALPCWIWVDAGLRDWINRNTGSEGDARRVLHRVIFMGITWLLATVVHHVHQLWWGLPPAGLGTAWVPK